MRNAREVHKPWRKLVTSPVAAASVATSAITTTVTAAIEAVVMTVSMMMAVRIVRSQKHEARRAQAVGCIGSL
jgi:hypothetical protein